MATPTTQKMLWALVRGQHGVVTRAQLVEFDLSSAAVRHRIAKGRLHPIHRGVYAVGRPELGRRGLWLAAVLGCGPGAALSHRDAAALWEMARVRPGAIHVSVAAPADPRPQGVVVHRRTSLEPGNVTERDGIPVTRPADTLVDLAACLERPALEAAINEADKHELIDPEALRRALGRMQGRRGVAALRKALDRRTFMLTDSALERRFLPIARRAGLPRPETGVRLSGFKVDFYWPALELVVETDACAITALRRSRRGTCSATRPTPSPD